MIKKGYWEFPGSLFCGYVIVAAVVRVVMRRWGGAGDLVVCMIMCDSTTAKSDHMILLYPLREP